MTIRIVTDSTCDLPQRFIEQFDIAVVPAYVNVGSESFVDRVDLTHDQFYKDLPNFKDHPTTSAPAPGIFGEVYERLRDEGADQILSMHVSADLSAFINSARLGADSVDNVAIEIVDSRTVSMGLGLLVLSAARALADGQTMAQVLQLLQHQIPRTRVYAGVDTLDYLRRSGRVGFATAGIGSLLKIKPILVVEDGKATSFDRVRTARKLIPRLVELAEEQGSLEALAIVHSNAPARASELKQQLTPFFPNGSDQIMTTVGPAIGAHVGPGTIGFACIAG